MKNMIAILCFIILPIFSMKINQPKFCIHCKYYIQKDGYNGKCSLFTKNEESDIDFLVNGKKNILDDNYIYYAATARGDENMCGKEGKYYKKKRVVNKNI